MPQSQDTQRIVTGGSTNFNATRTRIRLPPLLPGDTIDGLRVRCVELVPAAPDDPKDVRIRVCQSAARVADTDAAFDAAPTVILSATDLICTQALVDATAGANKVLNTVELYIPLFAYVTARERYIAVDVVNATDNVDFNGTFFFQVFRNLGAPKD